jgi:hypothetical protein
VRVTFESGAGLTTIAARSSDRDRARAIADAFSDATVAAYRALAQSRSERLIGRLQRRSGDLRSELRRYDAQIRSAARRGSPAASAQPTEDLRRIADLEARRAAVVANLNAARAAGSAAPAARSFPTPAQAAPVDSYPGIVVVKETPLPTAVPVARARAVTGLSEAALIERIGTIDAQLAALHARPSTLRRPTDNANRLLSDRKRAARAFDENRRALSIANSERAAALDALAVRARSEFAERLVPPAVAAAVVAAAGAGLAIGAAYLAEAVDPRIRRSRHVEKLYGKPHIGSV